MTAGGYRSAKEISDTVAGALRDMAILIGEPGSGPVTLETGGTLQPGLGFRDDAAALDIRARDLGQGLFKIIVLGEFKNGKSTLLNAMLGTKILPAKAAPATAIITILVYGDQRMVAIHENGRPEPRLLDWENFVEEFQLTRADQDTLQDHGFVDRFASVDYAQLECLHPICANGVKLIDSPGLGESISRTRVATNFLKQSQAVIFVLNAARILSQEEKTFIESVLGEGRLNHVFFVINRIDQIDEDSLEEIKTWVESGLRRHFLDTAGRLDHDLYDRRVFFLSARQALNARATQPSDEASLAASGLPQLERELERFLTSGEKIQAALTSTISVLAPLAGQTRRRIEQAKTALDQPLADLEQRRAEAEQRLGALSGRKTEIERTILLFGETIKYKVYADLRGYVEEMNETWEQDSQKFMNLDRAVSARNLLASYANKEARQRMAAAINEEILKYLQAKFGDWATRTPLVVQGDVDRMVAEIEAQVEDFQLELDEIADLFSGRATDRDRVNAEGRSAALLNVALSLGEISGMTGAIMVPDDWSGLIGRAVQQAVVVFVVGTLLTGGNFLIALVLVEAVHLGLQEGEMKKRIRQELGQKLHESLQTGVVDKQAFIFQAVEQRFTQFASSMTGAIQAQVDEARREQERIIGQKQDRSFSVDREKNRLDGIGRKVEELLVMLRETANQAPVEPSSFPESVRR